MTYTIRNNKNGKEIEIDVKRIYLMLDFKDLEALGFKATDVWEIDA